MSTRGLINFEIDTNGHVLYTDENLEKLRLMFLDRSIIKDALLGPGDPGDFDKGSWHILCHLTAACAVFKKSDHFIWMEISHVPLIDEYLATVTIKTDKEIVTTFPLVSEQGQEIIKDAQLLGFIEGSSQGHISARDVIDPPDKFNTCTRQEYDMDEKSLKEGGRVWEHWTITRDITTECTVGTSILKSFLAMVSNCGGALVSSVARGRKDYHHPEQLSALIHFGIIGEKDVIKDMCPIRIPQELEVILNIANPCVSVKAAKRLKWDYSKLSYFMFERRIDRWSKA